MSIAASYGVRWGTYMFWHVFTERLLSPVCDTQQVYGAALTRHTETQQQLRLSRLSNRRTMGPVLQQARMNKLNLVTHVEALV